MSDEQYDSDEPRRYTGPDSGTPSSSSSTPSSALASPRSVASEVVAQITGAAVSLFCAWKAAGLLMDNTPGPLGVPKWGWGLLALATIATPTSWVQLRKLLVALRGGR